ncbi:MAG: hypothetical protein K6G26_04095 [Lachnospiraceae bacterium]|nr:hypothetical protein [Lachnospiraceae bacterium]
MSSRLFVLKLKDILIFLGIISLIIVIITILIFKFKPDSEKKEKNSNDLTYVPGIYTKELVLGKNTLELAVIIDAGCIKSVGLTNLNESISAMYPLFEPSVSALESQLVNGTNVDELILDSDSLYTQTLLVEAIKECLVSASPVN